MFFADDLQVIKEEVSNESDYRVKHQGPELHLKEEKEEVSASPLTAGVWIFVLFQLWPFSCVCVYMSITLIVTL